MREFVQRHGFKLFMGVLFLGVVLHALTMSYSPMHWVDEVQIMEMARGGIGNKPTGWSMCYVETKSGNLMSWGPYYLGSFICESAYQFFGEMGPRLCCLAFLVILAFLVYRYVLCCVGDRVLAFSVGMMTFAYPTMVASVRGGRVDVVAFVFLFAGLNILRGERLLSLRFMATGSAAILMVFSWATAFMLLPIFLWALLPSSIDWRVNRNGIIKRFSCFVVGGLLTAIVLMLPYYGRLDELVQICQQIASLNLPKAKSVQLFVFARNVFSFPFVLALGLLPLFFLKRLWFLACVTLIFAAICINTRIYGFRMLYFLPYAIMGIVHAVGGTQNQKLKTLYCWISLCVAVACFGWSVLIRNVTDCFVRPWRDFSFVESRLTQVIPENACVYNDSYQLYYLGRKHGWMMYKGLSAKLMKPIISKRRCEYCVFEKDFLAEDIKAWLKEIGFVQKLDVIYPERKCAGAFLRLLSASNRLASPGPYVVYEKCAH